MGGEVVKGQGVAGVVMRRDPQLVKGSRSEPGHAEDALRRLHAVGDQTPLEQCDTLLLLGVMRRVMHHMVSDTRNTLTHTQDPLSPAAASI